MNEQSPEAASGTQASARWPLYFGAVLLFIVVSAALIWRTDGMDAGEARPTTARVGFLAPEVELPQLVDGHSSTRANLTSLTGHPVLVNFWATWCSPCREEFPAMQAKYAQYKAAHQLVIVGIDVQGDSGPAAAQHFVRQMGATFPIWLDADGSAEAAYRVQALPTTVFVDRSGVIQDMLVGGPMTEDYLDRELNRIF
jgi:cytochrome c biogenesis protein CcmG, thiol:disulfide interchange protein DsbE